MRSSRKQFGSAAVLLGGLLIISGHAGANPVSPLHCLPLGTPEGWEVPAQWSQWQVIDMEGQATQSQTGYNDADQNGLVSQGDELSLTGVGSGTIVEPVKPAYEITRDALDWILIPTGPYSGDNPQDETWETLYPTMGEEHAMSTWEDANHSGIFDPGDTVILDGEAWDVSRITLDAAGYFPGSATAESTWGQIKAFLGLRR